MAPVAGYRFGVRPTCNFQPATCNTSWNVRRTSAPGLFAKQCVPSGKWCKSTAFRHSCARSSKRAGGFIPRIALDQCRDPERYRTCAPVRPQSIVSDALPRYGSEPGAIPVEVSNFAVEPGLR